MVAITPAIARANEIEIARRAAGHASLRRRNDGTRRLAYSAWDARIYASLAGYLFTGVPGECWPSLRTLAKRHGCSPETAGASVRRLAAGGWITITQWAQHTANGLRWHQRYELHAHPVTRSLDEQEAILAHRAPPLLREGAKERLRALAVQNAARRVAQMMGSVSPAMRPEFGRSVDSESISLRPLPVPRPVASRFLALRHEHPAPRHVSGRITVHHEMPRTAEEQVAILLMSMGTARLE